MMIIIQAINMMRFPPKPILDKLLRCLCSTILSGLIYDRYSNQYISIKGRLIRDGVITAIS
ncbi:hypothetical protein [Clostridium ganghwense]|uniref:hypothetical protein n=1 Tax=Clostridium ganghwense TaxID=312089 RepID=UPI00227D18A0|nr:hypothetical protein [Clostridium ganghwense]